MQQLSGLDAEFLAMESPTVFGHVGSLSMLDPSTVDGPFDLKHLTDHVASRLHLVPVFRRRVVDVPFGLAQPYWVEDPDFGLDYHVREIALPAPGSDVQLARQVARLHARPLDRTRPLWELYLITGLAEGRAAIYCKIHHATMDGVGGDAMLSAILDPTPQPRPLPPAPTWNPRPLPGTAAMLARGAVGLAWQPFNAVRVSADLVRHSPGLAAAFAERLPLPCVVRRGGGVGGVGGAGGVGGVAGAGGAGTKPVLPHAGLRAPSTPFNAPIGPHRRVALADLSLDEVKTVRRRAGVTVNDVFMAVAAGALRRWLADHDALPSSPLVAAVPVSVRDEQHMNSYGNRVSAMLAALPTHVDDPLARLAAASAAMLAAKNDHGTIPPTLLADASELAPPVLAGLGWRLAASLQLMQRVNPWNLFVSNVPGPSMPLYYGGARLLGYFPISAIAHGQGLNVTVFSYHDRMCVGLLADRTLIPDLDVMARYVSEELDLLLAATAAAEGAPKNGTPDNGPPEKGTAPAAARPRTRRPRRPVS